MTLKHVWEALDGSKPKGEDQTTIPAGKHEIERIPNPHGYDAPWLVLKGTLIGATEGSWRQWAGPQWDEWQVVIDD